MTLVAGASRRVRSEAAPHHHEPQPSATCCRSACSSSTARWARDPRREPGRSSATTSGSRTAARSSTSRGPTSSQHDPRVASSRPARDAVETNTFGGDAATCSRSSGSQSARARDQPRAGAGRARGVRRASARAEQPALRARLDGARHQARDARARRSYDALKRLVRRAGARPARRRRRRLPDRDVPGPAADQGGAQRRARRARARRGVDVPIFVSVTMEVTGTMLVGTEMAAAIALLDPYPIDVLGHQLRDRPARDGRARAPARPDVPRSDRACTPTRGCRSSSTGQPLYPLTPEELADWLLRFVEEDGRQHGRRLLRHDAGAHCGGRARWLGDARAEAAQARRTCRRSPASTRPVPLWQDNSVLFVGERSNANGSKAFSEHLLDGRRRRAWSRWAASRCATAATCSTCARPTSAATRSRT